VRFRDLLAMGLSALWRQKLRTFLTLLGVLVGAATLSVSLSLGRGLHQAINDQFRKQEELRYIHVHPAYRGLEGDRAGVPPEVLELAGDLSEERRERLRDIAAQRWKRRNPTTPPKPLTAKSLEELAAIEHVVSVTPDVSGVGRLNLTDQSVEADFYGVRADHRRLPERIDLGRGFTSDDAREALVHEYALYQLGIRDERGFEQVIGKEIRLEASGGGRSPLALLSLLGSDVATLSAVEMQVLEKAFQQLPQALDRLDLSSTERALLEKALQRKSPGQKKKESWRVGENFRIVGVLRSPRKDKDRDADAITFEGPPLREADILIPIHAADELMRKAPHRQERGYSTVRLVVDHEDHLKSVANAVKALGYDQFSLGVFVQQVRTNITLIGFGMNFIALIALFVAALGIANTLFTTVLERTKEIGLMKAVGATDRHVLTIFLIEGGLIGLLGGAVGVLIGWLVSIPGDAYARSLMAEQTLEKAPDTLFLFPMWLVIGVPLFAVTITTLAAALPARRAARVEPVEALRHE
jgi:putative ABC transport system permease protein